MPPRARRTRPARVPSGVLRLTSQRNEPTRPMRSLRRSWRRRERSSRTSPRRVIPATTTGTAMARNRTRFNRASSRSRGRRTSTASRTTALLVDPNCGAGKLPRLGRRLRRRRLADGQRARRQPEVESAQAAGSRPEHGRRAEHGPDRQDGQHDLPRHRRAEPLLVRLRGRRRHLQVDRRRQQLEEARRHVRQQRDVRMRHPRRGRVPRSRDPVDRDRPARREPHLRRVGPGCPRALARDRQRRHDAPRAGRECARALRVDRRRRDVHDGLERRQPGLVRHQRRRARPAEPSRRLRLGVRPRALAARCRRGADRLQPGLRAPVQPGRRASTGRCSR